jgi:hypothetical protein
LRGVAAGKGKSDLGFWKGEGEGEKGKREKREGWRGRGGWRLEKEKVREKVI